MSEKTILLAEDDESHEALFRRAIEQTDVACQLDVVQNGAEVLDYLFVRADYEDRRFRERPDLIFLDLKMPVMNGLEVLQVMRRIRGADLEKMPPVVVLTSSEDDGDINEAYRLGAKSYICKPTGFPEFVRAVQGTVEYWLELNRPPTKPRKAARSPVEDQHLQVER